MTISNNDINYDLALENNNNILKRLSKGLVKLGFKLENIITTDFSVEQQFESYKENNKYKQKQVGYKINHKIKLSFNLNHTLINEVINVIQQTNSNILFNINFSVANTEIVKRELLEAAYKTAYNDATSLANISNNKLGEVLEISYNFDNLNYNSPFLLRSRVMATGDFNFEPEPINLEEEVRVVFELKSII